VAFSELRRVGKTPFDGTAGKDVLRVPNILNNRLLQKNSTLYLRMNFYYVIRLTKKLH